MLLGNDLDPAWLQQLTIFGGRMFINNKVENIFINQPQFAIAKRFNWDCKVAKWIASNKTMVVNLSFVYTVEDVDDKHEKDLVYLNFVKGIGEGYATRPAFKMLK